MKKFLSGILMGWLLLGAHPIFAGWHVGEFKDLAVEIEYFDYAYKLPSGEPVYYIGSTMRYRITLRNRGNRTFKNFQSKITLRWAGNFSCKRWWYDNQFASYLLDTLLPGNADSGLRMADMGKGGTVSYEATYYIPWGICPGQAYARIEGRHRNKSGRDSVASFRIPLGVRVARK